MTKRRDDIRRRPRLTSAQAGAAAKPKSPASTFRYLESSAVLAALLEQDVGAIKAIRAAGQRVTSALTFAEAARALVRARASGRLTGGQERTALRAVRTLTRRCAVIAVSESVLARAGRPFPVEPIRTLDAIHLATAELLGSVPRFLTVVTRDARIRENATALGYRVE